MKEFIRTETQEKNSKVTEYEVTDMPVEDKVMVMDAVMAEVQPELFEPVVKGQIAVETVEVKYFRHICHNDEGKVCELIEIDGNEVNP